jgi:hypothetical protein
MSSGPNKRGSTNASALAIPHTVTAWHLSAIVSQSALCTATVPGAFSAAFCAAASPHRALLRVQFCIHAATDCRDISDRGRAAYPARHEANCMPRVSRSAKGLIWNNKCLQHNASKAWWSSLWCQQESFLRINRPCFQSVMLSKKVDSCLEEGRQLARQ